MTLARNGREALDLLGSERGASVDLILSDLLMPEVRAPRPRPALPTASKTAGAHGRRARAGVGHGAGRAGGAHAQGRARRGYAHTFRVRSTHRPPPRAPLTGRRRAAVMSSESGKDFIAQALQAGAADYLIKPVKRSAVTMLWQHV